MELINIYEYTEYIVNQKEEDLPYSKINMIYIYSKFLHTSVTPDMILKDKVFRNLITTTGIPTEKNEITREVIHTKDLRKCILFRDLENNEPIHDWKVNGYDFYLLIKELVDTSTEINVEYYNKFSKQVLREKAKSNTEKYLIEEGIPEENIIVNVKPSEYNPIEHEEFEYPDVKLHIPSNNSLTIEYIHNKYGVHLQWDEENKCKFELYDIHSGVIELPLSLEDVLDLYEMSILDINPFARKRYNESMGETVNRLLKSYKRMK